MYGYNILYSNVLMAVSLRLKKWKSDSAETSLWERLTNARNAILANKHKVLLVATIFKLSPGERKNVWKLSYLR